MLKKEITYVDFDGKERKEEHYFNLTQSEVVEMELSVKGGLVEGINKMVAAEDGEAIMKFFKELILKAYGQKSTDGKYFRKEPQAALEFSWSGAYDKLFTELVTEPDKAAAFLNGIVPVMPEQAK